jgi:hypothetical protein
MKGEGYNLTISQSHKYRVYHQLSRISPTSPQEELMRDPDTPKGTIALMLVYVVIIIALWSNVYLTILSRGATQ